MAIDRMNEDVVLIVDDVPENLSLLYDALDEAGYAVLVATNGESALQRARRHQPVHRRRPGGQRAAQALADFIGRSTVVCKPQGARSYDRMVARCYLNGRDDLASYMVQQGHALAWTLYSMDYLGDMQEAKSRRRGAWVSTFVEPWTYRRQSR